MAGGANAFGTPNFSDAIPSDPANQGSMGPEGMGSNRTDEHTFESGMPPAARMAMESNWSALVDDDGLSGHSMDQGEVADKWPGEGIRGFRTSPIGGSFNPGNGKNTGSCAEERSNAA